MTAIGYKELWSECPQFVTDKEAQLQEFASLIREWNDKINVTSRKDIDQLEHNHILPCLAVSSIIQFKPGTRIMDVGCGGGFPGLPMAIIYPETKFLMVDSVGKKLKVIDDIIEKLGLKNAETRHCRVEEIKNQFDFITGRAVTALPTFIPWVRKKIKKSNLNDMPNGIFYWKGGELEAELKKEKIKTTKIFKLDELLTDTSFEDKYIAYFNL